MRLVVGIAVFVAVTQFLHELGRRIAQVDRDLARFILAHERHRGIERVVAGIALGGDGKVDDGLAQRELSFRRAEALIGLDRVVRELDGARVGDADVFPRHADDAAPQVFRIGAAVQHAAQPVQRGVRMRAAHGFVQRRDLVVEIVAALVEAARVQGQRVLDEFARDVGRFRRVGRRLRLLQQVQEAAGIAVRVADQRLYRDVVELQVRQAALLAGAFQQLAHLVVIQRLQHVHLRARQQCRVDFERRVFRRRADQRDEAGFHERQQRVLLRLVEAS